MSLFVATIMGKFVYPLLLFTRAKEGLLGRTYSKWESSPSRAEK